MNRLLMKTAAIGLLLGAVGTASAHHSGALYDLSRTVTVKGTVQSFRWANPHVLAWIEGETQAGETPQIWRLEFSSPGNLTRMGHTKRSLNPGEIIAVECNQLRDGSLAGWVDKITLANGQVLNFRFADLEKPGLQ